MDNQDMEKFEQEIQNLENLNINNIFELINKVI